MQHLHIYLPVIRLVLVFGVKRREAQELILACLWSERREAQELTLACLWSERREAQELTLVWYSKTLRKI